MYVSFDGTGVTYPDNLEVVELISGFRKGVIDIRSIHIDYVLVAAQRDRQTYSNIKR